MGGIADYSGSLVLQMPIAEAACVALQLRPERTSVRVVSFGAAYVESARGAGAVEGL